MADPAKSEQPKTEFLGLMFRPFRLIISPTITWGEVANNSHIAPALLAQFVLIAIGKLIAWQPVGEMVQSVGGNPEPFVGKWTLLFELASIAILLLTANLLLSGLIFITLTILGFKQRFSILFVWVAYSLIPICLGYLVGTVPLWFIQPLSTDMASILSWQLKPFGFSLASLLPNIFPPLSAQWFFASAFDVFGCWAIMLFAYGSRHFLKFDFLRSVWITCGLVLIFFLAASGMWQIFQTLLVSRG